MQTVKTAKKKSIKAKQELLSLIRINEKKIKLFCVERIGLFGSFVRNEQSKKSDVDLYIEFEHGKKSFDNFMGLSFFLEEIFNRRVELVTPESLSPYIGTHILQEVEYVSFTC